VASCRRGSHRCVGPQQAQVSVRMYVCNVVSTALACVYIIVTVLVSAALFSFQSSPPHTSLVHTHTHTLTSYINTCIHTQVPCQPHPPLLPFRPRHPPLPPPHPGWPRHLHALDCMRTHQLLAARNLHATFGRGGCASCINWGH